MNIRRTLISTIAASAVIGASMSGPAKAATKITNTPPTSLVWETSKEGVGFSALIGNRFAEPYMAMVRLPAGLVSPAHIKSANMFGVVVSGTITHIARGTEDDTEIPLSAGAFYKIPAGIAHVSKCISTEDCVTFLYQDGKFDFKPVAQ
jgi:quercetin dioxygenase-like cupin family protein